MSEGLKLPPLLELKMMCEQRAGHLDWPYRRLAEILGDFPELHWRMVAGRCLDYIAERENVRDGPRTLRTFMEREQRQVTPVPEAKPPPPRDLNVRCPGCGTTFNISAELRRRKQQDPRAIVSVCRTCHEEDLHHGDSRSKESVEREEAEPGA